MAVSSNGAYTLAESNLERILEKAKNTLNENYDIILPVSLAKKTLRI